MQKAQSSKEESKNYPYCYLVISEKEANNRNPFHDHFLASKGFAIKLEAILDEGI